MKMNTFASSSSEIGSYVPLQHEIHDALREQHPEWIQPNGDCPTCESYESRLAELLTIFQKEHLSPRPLPEAHNVFDEHCDIAQRP
jgi:hypothetical protein